MGTLGFSSEFAAKSEHYGLSALTDFVFVHGVRCISRARTPTGPLPSPLPRIHPETKVWGRNGPDFGSDLALGVLGFWQNSRVLAGQRVH